MIEGHGALSTAISLSVLTAIIVSLIQQERGALPFGPNTKPKPVRTIAIDPPKPIQDRMPQYARGTQ